MNSPTVASEVFPFEPNAKELKALRQFVSKDPARSHLAALWRYMSDGGITYVATDGHTICLRRSGTHREMPLHEIAKLAPENLDQTGANDPPKWASVMGAPDCKKNAGVYGINTDYMARIGDVERAAGARAAEDYVPKPYEIMKDQAKRRADLKASQRATWRIPSDARDGWHWHLDTDAARWDGIIMPRRV